ncbi:MAG: lycopene cyclase family protein [Bacteroidota bacterium]
MTTCVDYDYIISGAGAAGLSLAYWLINSPLADKKILLLDKTPKISNDRTWCFWAKQALPFAACKQLSWGTLAVSYQNERHISDIHPYRYYHTRSEDFYAEILALLATRPNVHLKYEDITEWGSDQGQAWVSTTKGTYTSQWLFNSLPPSLSSSPAIIRQAQHFIGVHLRTKTKAFDPDCVEFMDFRVPQLDAPCFMYVLPFSADEALLEFTVFSAETFDQAIYHREIQRYLREKYEIQDWEPIELEQGYIPMTNQTFERKESPRVLNIGSRGGLTKPTTGYTFSPIQKDCQAIVASLLAYDTPFAIAEKPSRYRFYDRLLLTIMDQEPFRIAPIMSRLFQANSFPRILQFLDEKSSFLQEINMLVRLPWAPFLRAILSPLFYDSFFSTSQLPHRRVQPTSVSDLPLDSPLAPVDGNDDLHPHHGSYRNSSRSHRSPGLPTTVSTP